MSVQRMPDSTKVRAYVLTHVGGAGTTSAIVVPQWGANVVAFALANPELLWPTSCLEAVDFATVAMRPGSFGVPLLAPTPGRVGAEQSGYFRYGGADYVTESKRHGFFRDAVWDKASLTADTIVCRAQFHKRGERDSQEFPYSLGAEYSIRVGEGKLTLRLAVTNIGSALQPFAAGWHPYLARGDRCALRIPAAARWELDCNREPVPTGRLLTVSGRDDFRSGRVLDEHEHWDDVFTELTGEDGRAACYTEEQRQLLDKQQRLRSVIIRRDISFNTNGSGENARALRHVQLYTPPDRAAIALEPLSAPPNAINLFSQGHERSDIVEIAPGATVSFSTEIGISITVTD